MTVSYRGLKESRTLPILVANSAERIMKDVRETAESPVSLD